MCYEVYLSTDSPDDLAGLNSERVRFEKMADTLADPGIALLEFPNKWYVGSKSGCSCDFRFLHPDSVELGFAEPEPWYPEETDAVDATRELYRRLKAILTAGHRLDLLSRWEGDRSGGIITLDVSLDQVTERAFRLFEAHKFRCRLGP